MIQISRTLKNQRGQGLIEYLIVVALIAVATIGVMRYVGESVNARFATIGKALSGDRKEYKSTLNEELLRQRDMGDFMNGAASNGKGTSASGM